jgi:hypothetical protein
MAASLPAAAPPIADDDEALQSSHSPPAINQGIIPEELLYNHLDFCEIVVIEKGNIYDFKNRGWVTLDTHANIEKFTKKKLIK